jgi:hypothetical protein
VEAEVEADFVFGFVDGAAGESGAGALAVGAGGVAAAGAPAEGASGVDWLNTALAPAKLMAIATVKARIAFRYIFNMVGSKPLADSDDG